MKLPCLPPQVVHSVPQWATVGHSGPQWDTVGQCMCECNLSLGFSLRSGSVDLEPLPSPADSSVPANRRGSSASASQSEWRDEDTDQTCPLLCPRMCPLWSGMKFWQTTSGSYLYCVDIKLYNQTGRLHTVTRVPVRYRPCYEHRLLVQWKIITDSFSNFLFVFNS